MKLTHLGSDASKSNVNFEYLIKTELIDTSRVLLLFELKFTEKLINSGSIEP